MIIGGCIIVTIRKFHKLQKTKSQVGHSKHAINGMFCEIPALQTDIDQIFTKILEVNLFAFAYRLFHEDFSPIDGMDG